MDAKGKERGILKMESRDKSQESRLVLTPQVSRERSPASPQPSVDRLSVTWADPDPYSMVSAARPPLEPAVEVKFSTTTAGDLSEDEDYSASLSAVLRQRRASVRRSRKGRARRPSSPFLTDEPRPRRRSSVFTTSSGDTAISMEESQPAAVSQEQIFENIHLHKEVLGSVKQQPLGMSRKLKLVHQAKAYIKRHEGQLQERLAQSKSTRDIYARFNILLNSRWQQMKREAANTSNLLIPWELRIKEIESHFGSVVASYFTFLRWLFWVNLVIAFTLLVFVIVPECLTANKAEAGDRKSPMEGEERNASNLLILWEFEGRLKYSPIFYGYYSNVVRPEYKMPLAYFLTGLAVYVYSFVAILRKMAENSRMSKLSEKEDECVFSWKLFTGWDYMIGNAETAHNRIASVTLGFKEALLEEAEKKKDLRNWRIITLRALVNVCVLILLVVSAYAVVTVVSESEDTMSQSNNWWRENKTTIVVTVISITFPVFFELLGFLEHYHPRKQLRLQLARIMLLNLLNLYSLIFAQFSKIEGMSKELDALKPSVVMNETRLCQPYVLIECIEELVPCSCNISFTTFPPEGTTPMAITNTITNTLPAMTTTPAFTSTTTKPPDKNVTNQTAQKLLSQNLIERSTENVVDVIKFDVNVSGENNFDNKITTTEDPVKKQMRIINDMFFKNYNDTNDSEINENDDGPLSFYDNNSNETDVENQTVDDGNSVNSISSTNYASTAITIVENNTTDQFNFTDEDIESNITDYVSSNDTNYVTETLVTYNYSNQTDISSVTETESSFTDFSVHIDPTNKYPSDSGINSLNYSTITEMKINPTPYTPSKVEYNNTVINETNSTIPTTRLTIKNLTGVTLCPNITFNSTCRCNGTDEIHMFFISNCTLRETRCYQRKCNMSLCEQNTTELDRVYVDRSNRKIYNLTIATRKKLRKMCWETMFGQELVKLTVMDLVFVLLGTLFMDFFRALFVRYMNRCWCWDLEKKFPEYGDFKIAENILHLINNQGMVWMGMFFSPGLVVLNVSKLMIMMYLRSWAVMTCNVPHEVVFRVSKSNNFYLALLLTMLFLCVLPVGYTIVWVKPSWHCGPFSEYEKIYQILTLNMNERLHDRLKFALEYIASPAIVIPLLVLLVLIIYYLTSLTNSLREANNDLKIQLRRERTEERRKMFQLADTRRAGSSALDNTPFARWKKALPALPLNKSVDSDDRKTTTEEGETVKAAKKKGGVLAKIVGLAVDKKTEESVSDDAPSPNNGDDETDTDFHEALPKEVLKLKHIVVSKRSSVDFKPDNLKDNLIVALDNDRSEKRPDRALEIPPIVEDTHERRLQRNETADSFSSVIPVITISTTESDDEVLAKKDTKREKEDKKEKGGNTKVKSSGLIRQSSVDSGNDHKPQKDRPDEVQKYQHTL